MDAAKQQPFRVADWHVDPASSRISSGGKVAKLEPRVMDVLVYLAARAGEVVSREELEATVWGGRTISYDALTTTVQKLRRALADDARQPRIIETVSKKGYRMVASVRYAETPRAPASVLGRGARGAQRAKRWWRASVSGLLAIALAIATIWVSLQFLQWPAQTPATGAGPYSIAVLPFDNLSGDPAQAFFADGMTDDLITKLARNPQLLVIARDSSFLYKDASLDIRDIAARLDVRYILHGSIRRAGEQVTFNAQLVDSSTGSHLWADRYDGRLADVFDLQDSVVRNVLSALSLTEDRLAPLSARAQHTASAQAYDYFLHGRNRFFRYANKQDNRKARELYRKAIELDPGFALAYAMLAWTYAFEAMNGWSDVRDDALARAQALAERAIELNNELPVGYFVTGLVYRERGEYVKALVEAEKAIAIDASYANAHVLLATLLYYAGRPQEGLERIEKAMRLNPHHPYNYPFHLGQAYFILGRYHKAIAALEQGLETNPSSERMRVWLAAAYAQAGHAEEARWQTEQVLTLNPDFSLRRIREAFPFKDPADMERFLEGLRRAGLTQ